MDTLFIPLAYVMEYFKPLTKSEHDRAVWNVNNETWVVRSWSAARLRIVYCKGML